MQDKHFARLAQRNLSGKDVLDELEQDVGGEPDDAEESDAEKDGQKQLAEKIPIKCGEKPHALQPEIFAQVILAHQLVVGGFHVGAGKNQASVGNDVGAIHNGKRRLRVVVGQEDAEAAFLEHVDQVLDVLDGDRVDAGERFVEQEEARVGRDRAA